MNEEATARLVEIIARAFDPRTFELPRINLHGDMYKHAYDKARSVLTSIEAAGMRVVPVEPTEEMLRAARNSAVANGSPMSKGPHEVWRAMISAFSPRSDK